MTQIQTHESSLSGVSRQMVWTGTDLSPTPARWQHLLLSSGNVQHCEPGIVVFSSDCSGRKSLLVEEGAVALTHQLSTGRQVFLGVRCPGEMFGYSKYILDHSFQLSATTLTSCILRVIDTRQIIDAVRNGGEAGLLLLRQQAFDLSQAAVNLMKFMHLDACVRVECFLAQLAIASQADTTKEFHIVLPLTDSFIADLLGISPQQFTVVKRKLAKEGKVQHMPETRTWILFPSSVK